MEVLLNATLAGGVAIGTASNLLFNPSEPFLVGLAAGMLSAFGYLTLNQYFKTKGDLHDTCGVHFLHGMPGILGGVVGAFATGRC